ncbi:hypothetical protein Acsp06_46970 [Actinomycetospora sp. NBRC 106375]|uniref:hypothetical protein n=1 Tax=Actinomycetospora sp. NBRC 106375 TaxID=3032207 RepID=UPI00249FF057|nr:hypothetical protein [Actinomycetospora sp. NBRC 106375]GLZ48512.1 hypothetical protein Acsp06_46970 [Actinomycetospora sp. NBRC 106375]
MSPLLIQWDRIRRRWVLILVIGLLAAGGALGAALLQGTTYTGRAALTIVSVDRAPEQDTVLAQGYADYFNQASSQEVLRQSAGVPTTVTLNARIAAASPIVYVEATADTADVAQDSATKMAVALRNDVNQGLQSNSAAQIQQLTGQLNAARAQNNSDEVGRLQDAISNLQSGTNQLQDLQLNAGVSSNPSNALRNAGAAALGGVLLGALLAIALGRFENRIVTPNEVRDRLGLAVLAVVGGRRRSGEDGRGQLLRSLTGLTNPYGMPTPGALALTGPYTSRASKSRVAVALAGLRALQGQTTLLLQTDLEADPLPSELSTLSGVADFLAERGGSRVDGKIFTNGRALLVSPPGSKRDDLFALFSKTHVQRLVTQGIALADLVIIDAPPVESVEGQVVCAVADRALLVLEEGETRAKDASSALDALGRTGSTALGVVLVRNPNQMVDPGFLSERNWAPVQLPAGPPPPRPVPSPQSGPGGSGGSGPRPGGQQVPPADRTAPISAKKLEEARESFSREGVVGGVTTTASAAPTGAANGTNGSHRPTPPDQGVRGVNGTAAAPDVKASGGAAPGQRSEKDEPVAGGGALGNRPSPGGAGRSPNASSAAQAPGGAAPGSKPAPGGQQPGPDAVPGPSARVVRRTGSEGVKPSPQPKPGGEPPNGGGPQGARPGGVNTPTPTPKPSPGTPSPSAPKKPTPADAASPAAAPKPTTKPGTSGTVPPGGAPSGDNSPPATPKASSPATTPGSPEGAKRIGTARFTSSRPAGGNGNAGKPGPAPRPTPQPTGATSGKGDQPSKRSDSLSAPTVTMRREK